MYLAKEEEVLKILPIKLNSQVKEFLYLDGMQEIRVKIGKPVILYSHMGEKILDYVPTEEDIKYMMIKMSNYSLYAFEEEIKQGYITLKGGHRVGIAGECVMDKDTVRTIKSVSSLNIRVCREFIGSSNKVMPFITSNGQVYNTLIISPPKCGKTTILRDIGKNISNGMHSLKLSGKKVAIIDERSEIAASYNGIPQMNVGIRTDVLDNCLKKTGMIMAIRSLSPEVIICDEIGTLGELEALNMAFNSGVNIIVTVHGFDIEDVYCRKVFKELIENRVLERVVVLSNRKGVGTIEKVYKVMLGGEFKCLNL